MYFIDTGDTLRVFVHNFIIGFKISFFSDINVYLQQIKQFILLLRNNMTFLQFLRASAMLKHVIDIGWTSVRHTLALYQNG